MNSNPNYASRSSENERASIQLNGRRYTVDQASTLAMNELGRRNARGAANIYDLILAVEPAHAETHNHRGIALQELKRFSDALASYDRAIAAKPSYADAHLNRGNLLLTLRRLDEALTCYDNLVRLNPTYAAAYNSRGITLQELKRYEDALANYDKALSLKSDYLEAHNNRGLVLRALSRYADALACYDKIIAFDSRDPVAHNNRGLTLNELRRYSEAQASFAKAIALQPGYAVAHNNLGVTLQAMHRFAEALASFDKAITLKPDYAMAYNNRGLLLKELKQYGPALASFDRAIALKPDYPISHNNRALTLLEMRRHQEALESCARAIAIDPNSAEAYSIRGANLAQLKLYDEALASCDKAIELKPDYAQSYQNRGIIMVNKGDMAEAEKMYLKALSVKPDFVLPLFSLTRIRKYKDVDHPDRAAIQALLDDPGVSPSDKDRLYYGLGKIFDDCKHYDEAFECYRRANDIGKVHAPYDPAKIRNLTDNIESVFTREFLAQSFSFGSDDASPIFIVGMPRSGTTLMASILSNHRSIGSAGELPTLAEAASKLPVLIEKDIPYPLAVTQMSAGVASRVIDDYIRRLRRDLEPNIPHVIDKNPLNFRYVGLIAMLFPKARVIHCMRHPLDTGLSNYFQNFSLAFDFSFDLRNIGHFYGEYERIMDHWRKNLPSQMIEVRYEDMIRRTEQVTRTVLDTLGLDWDESCLSPHTNRYAVETASNWQVRQPIYTGSLERWRRYEKHLTPLKEALQAAGCKAIGSAGNG